MKITMEESETHRKELSLHLGIKLNQTNVSTGYPAVNLEVAFQYCQPGYYINNNAIEYLY